MKLTANRLYIVAAGAGTQQAGGVEARSDFLAETGGCSPWAEQKCKPEVPKRGLTFSLKREAGASPVHGQSQSGGRAASCCGSVVSCGVVLAEANLYHTLVVHTVSDASS